VQVERWQGETMQVVTSLAGPSQLILVEVGRSSNLF
jgi:hypothetical protein